MKEAPGPNHLIFPEFWEGVRHVRFMLVGKKVLATVRFFLKVTES